MKREISEKALALIKKMQQGEMKELKLIIKADHRHFINSLNGYVLATSSYDFFSI